MGGSHAPGDSELQRLVLRAADGDAEARARWYETEFPVVWRLALGVLADATEAEDLAQEAMLHLSDRLDRWDPARPFAAWRTRIVLNLCRDRLRRRRARREAESRAAAESLPDVLPDPADAARAGEIRAYLTAALAALPQREREVFVLRDLEQRPVGEVAELLGLVESSVRSLSSLARRRLRELLGRRAPGLVADLEGGDA